MKQQNPAPSITVVVPAYNAEKYIVECINDIRQQTLTDFECLIVDDGSKDNTKKVIANSIKDDSRFKLLPLEQNSGVSAARNHALTQARGEYIIFLDSDDGFNPTLLEKLYTPAVIHGIDVVICNLELFDRSSGRVTPRVLNLDKDKTNTVMTPKKYGINRIFSSLGNAAWNKLIRRDILLRSHISFDETIRIHEDMLFCSILMTRTNDFFFVDEDLITYRVNNQQSALGGAVKYPFDTIHAVKKLEQYLKQHHLYTKYERAFYALCTTEIIYSLDLIIYSEHFNGAFYQAQTVLQRLPLDKIDKDQREKVSEICFGTPTKYLQYVVRKAHEQIDKQCLYIDELTATNKKFYDEIGRVHRLVAPFSNIYQKIKRLFKR